MKFGVSSYSYCRLVNSGEMKQIDVIGAAKDAGFDVIEFSTIAVPEGKTLPVFAEELRAESERVGLPIANYTIGADFLGGCGGDLKAEIERLKGEVDVAEILGAPGMRHDVLYGYPESWKGVRTFPAVLPRLVEGIRAVTEYAAEKGIRTMSENHGFIAQDSTRVEQMISAVNNPNYGALIDMGNFCCADENPAEAVGRLASVCFHAHAKDFFIRNGERPSPGEGFFQSRGGNYLRGTIIGHGDVPLAQCIRILRRAGYDGVISVEFEGMEDVRTGVRIGLENLKRLAAM